MELLQDCMAAPLRWLPVAVRLLQEFGNRLPLAVLDSWRSFLHVRGRMPVPTEGARSVWPLLGNQLLYTQSCVSVTLDPVTYTYMFAGGARCCG